MLTILVSHSLQMGSDECCKLMTDGNAHFQKGIWVFQWAAGSLGMA